MLLRSVLMTAIFFALEMVVAWATLGNKIGPIEILLMLAVAVVGGYFAGQHSGRKQAETH